VALHSGRGGEWPAWIGAAVEAVLVVRAGFEQGAAEAWMGMLCPWLLCGLCAPDDVHVAADGCLN
jgi:hypothetical protein